MKKKLISPALFIKTIIGINALFFATSLILSGKQVNFSLNPLTTLSPSINALVFMGASGTLPIDQYHQWWSLLTANWLHGSILHILFNMAALFHIGRLIVMTYGMHRMFTIYTISGIAGFYLSYLAGVAVTIGASASLCGLVGAAFYYGKTHDGQLGKAVLSNTSGWILSLIIFGVALPNINNWGHGGGFASGLLLARVMGYHEMKSENAVHRLLSWSCLTVSGVILGWVLISALLS